MVDLVTAREAVVTWLLARRGGSNFRLEGHPEALKDLGWLGLDWEESQGLTEDVWSRLQSELHVPLRVLDRGRPRPVEGGVEAVWLPALEGEVPDLERLGREGVMPEGVLSYLAESVWTPPRQMRYLTRSEMLREFDPAALQSEPRRYDPAELEERHLNFLAELTPAELWQRSLPYWKPGDLPEELEEREVLDLEALALLLGDQCKSLLDFPRLARFYFVAPRAEPDPELAARVEKSDGDNLFELLEELTPEQRLRLQQTVLGGEPPPDVAALELYQILGRERILQRLK